MAEKFLNFQLLTRVLMNVSQFSDRFQTSFSAQIPQQQFNPPQQQQQFAQLPRQQQQQQGALPLPGSGKSLFDSIVNRYLEI